jgi:hypothetical protein
VGRSSEVGASTRYGLDGPRIEYHPNGRAVQGEVLRPIACWDRGFESCRCQWSSGLRRGSAADRLLGLQVGIPPGGMDVCEVYVVQ